MALGRVPARAEKYLGPGTEILKRRNSSTESETRRLLLCPLPIAREDGRKRPCARRGQRLSLNKHGWVRGCSLTPHPVLAVEPPPMPSPARGEGANASACASDAV